MKNKTHITITEFMHVLHKITLSDRDALVVVVGETGSGKSTFMINGAYEYSKITGLPFDLDCITWQRGELVKWIEGEPGSGVGQKPEQSVVIADELISMFNSRNWAKSGQKSAIELLNKCRDRHLVLMGAVPNFWNIDIAFRNRTRFLVYIKKRGGKTDKDGNITAGKSYAWVFRQEQNPFSRDPWNESENRKVLRSGNPTKSKNFLFTIEFTDLPPKLKARYLQLRNTKRKGTEDQDANEPITELETRTLQRNKLIAYLTNVYSIHTNSVATMVNMSNSEIREIKAKWS
jgi:hypothetical protein